MGPGTVEEGVPGATGWGLPRLRDDSIYHPDAKKQSPVCYEHLGRSLREIEFPTAKPPCHVLS